MRLKRDLALLLVVMLGTILAACGGEETAEQTGAQAEKMKSAVQEKVMARDIVDIAVADGRFTTLVAAVKAAGLVETLKGEGPFTVFAPTDDAFAKLPEGTVDALLGDLPKLKSILLYHVVPGKVMAADVVKLQEAETALGESVAIFVEGDVVKVEGATVVITDIEASNGVIHVIDSVILPPGK